MEFVLVHTYLILHLKIIVCVLQQEITEICDICEIEPKAVKIGQKIDR